MTKLRGARVLVVGGSKGIGAAFAREAAASGARVSLIARGETELAVVATEIRATWRSADVTDAAALALAVSELGAFDIVVCCAGIALPGRFVDTPLEEFRQQLELNYLGAINVLKCVLPTRHMVLTSSTAGLSGVVGYSGYGPTKWAIRGLADTLRYEFPATQISVLYPPDTETPGFDLENTRRPRETIAVSGAVKPVKAQVVARTLVRGIERNRDTIAVDLLTKMLVPFGGIIEPLARRGIRKTISKALGSQPE